MTMNKISQRKKEIDTEDPIRKNLRILATVSHEIRNPLNAIIGISRLLRLPATEDERQVYLEGLVQTSENLLELVNNIMDFSKLESGKLAISAKPTDLRKTFRQNLMSQIAIAGKKGIDFYIEIDEALPSRLLIDHVKINQVVLNLVSNAVKFTSQGTVLLELKVVELTAGMATVKFSVQDTGIGIPKEKLKGIFEAFDQGGDDINLLYGGTGLGLSISKRVIDILGGELKVQSVFGRGSEFSFSLNLEIEQQASVEEPEQELVPVPQEFLTRNLKLLVVDDNKLNLLVVQKNLERWGIGYEVAYTGLGAVRKVQQEKFDLVLMDMHMPEMDGLEATRVIRNIHGCSELPVIGLTASTGKEFWGKLYEAGFSDLLMKPFRTEELLEKIVFHTKVKQVS